MSNQPKPPALMPAAARLLYICLTVICLYLLAVALYAGGDTADALRRDTFEGDVGTLRRDNAFGLLRGAYISSVLALGGAFLMDWEVRTAKRR